VLVEPGVIGGQERRRHVRWLAIEGDDPAVSTQNATISAASSL
jgi:hypothetical protein